MYLFWYIFKFKNIEEAINRLPNKFDYEQKLEYLKDKANRKFRMSKSDLNDYCSIISQRNYN